MFASVDGRGSVALDASARVRNDATGPISVSLCAGYYDESWAFQHGSRLEPFKYALHTTWLALSVTMRLGGPVFTRAAVGEDILNRNLIVLARR